ncbi:transcription termination factor NusA [Candidatus Saccharibacteria bacterium RIFCSPHIGHO2_12_FULL_49_19]|nr:MAG: transcription termination factor NusA [Candidatus Saccharibacteria bacterium RIFCSPHIGHO2_01_FULL_49_21]OGL36917.1 MAG: transcription termination factor NusA [Candidatus Saccharibacteria bacterium RIFCSPHIGHO2_12_FULL_49_19]OGL38107.1 MAG: transcription termination factor NusA [Candidatus Saccharibacteria bacterium RIFCSPLOWO2_01_FULL_49_22]
MDFKQLAAAIRVIAEEKNLPEDQVSEIVEQALAAAWRRDFGEREQEVRVSMNLNTGEVTAFVTKEVVEEVSDPRIQINLADAKSVDKKAKLGGTVEIVQKIENFGRVAAQTAKQVILQRLREAEREIVLSEFEDKIGTVVNGIVSRVEGRLVRVELGRAQGIMPISEQIQGEHYYPGQRLKLYLKDVEKGFRGPQLIVSRGSKEFVQQLFMAEVPEMDGAAVEIKEIAREAGVRSKIAVSSNVPGVDPVGTFVGGHGTRINAVRDEIGPSEMIDIIVWDEKPEVFIANAMKPANVSNVKLNKTDGKAVVIVPEDQLSIAIGKAGQNVRLAGKLTGYELDIEAEKGKGQKEAPSEDKQPGVESKPVVQKLKKKTELEDSLLKAIEEHGEEVQQETSNPKKDNIPTTEIKHNAADEKQPESAATDSPNTEN